MKKMAFLQIVQTYIKHHKKIAQITFCQYILNCQWNEQIPRKIQLKIMHTRKKKGNLVFSIKTLINNEKYPPTKITVSDNLICKYTKILRKKNCQS